MELAAVLQYEQHQGRYTSMRGAVVMFIEVVPEIEINIFF
jgi:hypothetical protein